MQNLDLLLHQEFSQKKIFLSFFVTDTSSVSQVIDFYLRGSKLVRFLAETKHTPRNFFVCELTYFRVGSVKSVLLKVSKFQKQLFLFSFEPKNEPNYFLNSALASKMSLIKKMKALNYVYQLWGI